MRWRPFKRRKYVPLRVGDDAPSRPLSGTMIAVDPKTNKITAIFQP